jgi:ribosomal protein S12 methylthiotransferase
MPKLNSVNLITLGCAKNTVDSEHLLYQLKKNGYQVFHESKVHRPVTIVNTCGFINDAKQESVETILNLIEAKKQGSIDILIVMGCLTQRYKKELKEELPEVDYFFGVEEQKVIVKTLNGKYDENKYYKRTLSTPKHYAYLKIAEGCNRKCSFCSIPLIRGNYTSIPIEKIKKELNFLLQQGVKEINLIAQDLSYYGYDIYKEYLLPELVEELSKMNPYWLRLLYTFPANFPYGILPVIKHNENVCNYVDIPVQHISDAVLKNMRRDITKANTINLLENIRKEIPDVTLRTTLMVGHPGETEKDFQQLLDFVKDFKFDRLGVFTYSEEEGTHSARNFEDEIPESVKNERAEEIMTIQREISAARNQEKVGKTMKIVIDSEDQDYYYGRTERDAPEVDNEVLVSKKRNPKLKQGKFYDAVITEASDYDLTATIK